MKKNKLIFIAVVCALSFGSYAKALDFQKKSSYTFNFTKKNIVKPILSFEDDSKIKRAYSLLKRTDTAACFSINTRELPAGAYTNWWLIYNNPEFCADENLPGGGKCSMSDLPNSSVNATVMWAAGGIVGPNNKTRFSACIDEGELSHQILLGTDGLIDSHKAEIHLIVRYHGPAEYSNATSLGEQLNDFTGGCEDTVAGINGFECADLQYSVHKSRYNY